MRRAVAQLVEQRTHNPSGRGFEPHPPYKMSQSTPDFAACHRLEIGAALRLTAAVQQRGLDDVDPVRRGPMRYLSGEGQQQNRSDMRV